MGSLGEAARGFLVWSSVFGNLLELIGFLIIAGATLANERKHKRAEDFEDRAAAMEHASRQALLEVDRTEGALRRQDPSGDLLGRVRLGATKSADIQDQRARERRGSARDLRFLAWKLDKKAFYVSFGFIVAGSALQMLGSLPS